MNLCDRICNQSTIYYREGRYNRQLSNKLSSPHVRSPKKHKHGKDSTKEWVARSFYSDPPNAERNSSFTVTNVKPSAHAKTSAENSGKDYTDANKNSYNGKPAIFFEQSQVESNAEKFKFCMVGKFPGWRPSLSQIRDWVSTKWKLEGHWSITLLDHRHVFIRLDNEADMLHVWTRGRWFIKGHLMRVFKWFPTFIPSNGEPSSSAIWVSLPSLPVAFFQEELLFPIASLAGKVFAMDGPTRNLTRTNVARVCVEVNLLKEHPPQVWVGVGDGGFWQDICYERLTSYCTDCREQGHSTKICQANRNYSQNTTRTSKPSIQNSDITRDRCPRGFFNQTKRVRISPIIEDGEGSRQPKRLGSSQSGKGKDKEIVERKAESLSDDSSLVCSYEEREKREGNEAIEHRGECSYGATIEQHLSAENRIDVSGKSMFSEAAAKSVVLGAETRPKGFGHHSEERRESFRRIVQKSPPRRRKFYSKRLDFLWGSKQKDYKPEAIRPCHLKKFKYSEVMKITKSFEEQIGQGGQGVVFKGKLPDGQEVAVKVNYKTREFFKELQVLNNTCHAHIIRLVGFRSEGSKRILVYEFMPNGSLAEIINAKESSSAYAEQGKQLCQIAIGIARGLEYLHEFDPPILHLDIKPSNILLDKDLCPKISDFGLAHRYSLVASGWHARGTVGFMAPELVFGDSGIGRGTDVFSYGMTLLEMASIRRLYGFGKNAEEYLLDPFLRDATLGRIPGLALEDTEKKMIIVGLWCIQLDPAIRPSFSRVIDMLKGSVDALCLPQDSSLQLCGYPE